MAIRCRCSLSIIDSQFSIVSVSRRKHKHEDHVNHEAWAIPYGDLVTLLLAFFVVMYAISTINEGKYRAVSDSLSAAFKGAPRSINPIEVGEKNPSAAEDPNAVLDPAGHMIGTRVSLMDPEQSSSGDAAAQKGRSDDNVLSPMDQVVANVESNMADLIQQGMLNIRRTDFGVEIEIRTDILFPSGSATMPPVATDVLQKLADTLKPLPYPMRVEGHTDNRPINTAAFPSNWELSAARAATVVHLFMQRGIDPSRLAVIGLGEFRPVADNGTEIGRNENRRVKVVILSNGATAEGAFSEGTGESAAVTAAVTAGAGGPVTVVVEAGKPAP